LNDHKNVAGVNARSPKDTIKIIGLLLRSRGSYNLKICHVLYTSSQDGLYQVFTRYKLPQTACYSGACAQAATGPDDELEELGHSVVDRCCGTLQELDSIGVNFYSAPFRLNKSQNSNYHFLYLTLLLSGAFDAQARVAYQIYRINELKEWDIAFNPDSKNGQKYLTALEKRGAQQLVDLIRSPQFAVIRKLLSEPRNTVHGVTLPAPSSGSDSINHPYNNYPVISLPWRPGEALWAAAQSHSSLEKWGLMEQKHTTISDRWGKYHRRAIFLEPYTYSKTLVEESFKLIESISIRTDFTQTQGQTSRFQSKTLMGYQESERDFLEMYDLLF